MMTNTFFNPKDNQHQADSSKNEKYVKKGFWQKAKANVAKVPFVLDTVGMYYCLIDQKTPLWAKGVVAGALAYFISPVDAIPDVLVGIGYTDDAAIITGALTALGSNVTDEHKTQASQSMKGEQFI